MSRRFPRIPWSVLGPIVGWGLVLGGVVTAPRWWPALNAWVDMALAEFRPSSARAHEERGHEDHADHGEEGEFLLLSRMAQLNLGLTAENLRPIELEAFHRSLTVPAVIAPRPGRTELHVSTPMTGMVTHVHAVPGETVHPGEVLFEIRLTHEDLVNVQTNYLETLQELDVEQAEIAWLEGATSLEGRLLRDRQYARDRLRAREQALRESLRLHGLSDRQVQWIADHRRLLDTLQVVAPSIDTHPEREELRLSVVEDAVSTPLDEGKSPLLTPPGPSGEKEEEILLLVARLGVHKGQAVQAGEELCVLADYRELYIEGQAFEHETQTVLRAIESGWGFTAILDGPQGPTELKSLEVAFMSNVIDPVTRVLPIYLKLRNEIVSDQINEDLQRFVTWRYRPGQRLRLRIPLDEQPDQIVLPAEAVAREGAEYYVFRQNGRERFDRIAVHLLYRDHEQVVIAQDGLLFPGDVVARRGAHQMLMAMKNQSGGAVDPHAGHTH